MYLPLSANILKIGNEKVKYKFSLDIPTRHFDGKNCFVHPRAGIVPGAGKNGLPRVIITMTSHDLSGSDVFKEAYGLQTDDLGKTWTIPQEIKGLAPRYIIIDGNNEMNCSYTPPIETEVIIKGIEIRVYLHYNGN